MIRIDINPRLVRSTQKLGSQVTVQVEQKLSAVAKGFGDSHKHSGLGLRKLGRRSYEVRVHLQWRIVFIKEEDRLTAYGLMNHDQVARWLKGRKGD
jgi:hypothetical protein